MTGRIMYFNRATWRFLVIPTREVILFCNTLSEIGLMVKQSMEEKDYIIAEKALSTMD